MHGTKQNRKEKKGFKMPACNYNLEQLCVSLSLIGKDSVMVGKAFKFVVDYVSRINCVQKVENRGTYYQLAGNNQSLQMLAANDERVEGRTIAIVINISRHYLSKQPVRFSAPKMCLKTKQLTLWFGRSSYQSHVMLTLSIHMLM